MSAFLMASLLALASLVHASSPASIEELPINQFQCIGTYRRHHAPGKPSRNFPSLNDSHAAA